MALPIGAPAFITFGATLVVAAIASLLLTSDSLPCNQTLNIASRLTRVHGIFAVILALPFFGWSIYLNITSFDSGVVVFPLAAIATGRQLCRPWWPKQRWITLAGCLWPTIAYAGGAFVFASKPASTILVTYSAVAAACWLSLAVSGFIVCSRERIDDVSDPLVPAAPH